MDNDAVQKVARRRRVMCPIPMLGSGGCAECIWARCAWYIVEEEECAVVALAGAVQAVACALEDRCYE